MYSSSILLVVIPELQHVFFTHKYLMFTGYLSSPPNVRNLEHLIPLKALLNLYGIIVI